MEMRQTGEIKLRGGEKLELWQDMDAFSYSWVVRIENTTNGRCDSLRFRTKMEALAYMEKGEIR